MDHWPRLRVGALRRVPAGIPGKARLARALLHELRSREDVTVESSTGARFVVPHLAEPVGFHLLVDGRYEAETDDFIARRLSAGDVFVDAGANIGVFTVSAARTVGARGRVLAVEPSPAVFPYLEQNIRLNQLENVLACRLALSDQAHDGVPFYAAPASHFGMGALAPQFDAEPCLVNTRPLDDVVADAGLPFVRVLKVDVEGHEIAVFRGARNLLERTPYPVIVFEFCDWAERRFAKPGQAQDFLMYLGYRIWPLRDYRTGNGPLRAPLTSGSAMLVAERSCEPVVVSRTRA
jgi:FkbM family methyltransferase